MNGRGTRVAIGLAVTAALVRLVPLQWLHPLNWDEIEFFHAARWIAEGRVPFRDYWEHHTPLAWFVFAPVTLLTDSPGVDAILLMRWAQVPVWIAAFWLANVFMRNAGLSPFARWSALTLALSSSMLMTSAVEFRLDPLAILFYFAGLVLWQRNAPRTLFAAGAMFCLTGLTNMRFGPLLVATVLLMCVVRERRWAIPLRALWIVAGGIVTLAISLLYFVATDSLRPFLQSVLVHNYIGDKYGPDYGPAFLHRLLVPFGVRIMAAERLFDWGAIDVGGVTITLLGIVAIAAALRKWRTPDEFFVMALLQIASVFVIARMIFVYNYHLQLVVLMMVPLLAMLFERTSRPRMVVALIAAAWCVNLFASVFRGKELDRAYQDRVMREVHARTRPNDTIWAGNLWGLRREPAYYFWFLPDMTARLVQQRYAPPYRLTEIVRQPPALLVVDQYAIRWLWNVQPELRPFFIRHYMPVWRNLWVPAMNARLQPGRGAEWIVLRPGTYRLFTGSAIAAHPWFRQPLRVSSYESSDAARLTLRLTRAAANPALLWSIDQKPANVDGTVTLRKGQRLRVMNRGSQPLGVILLSGSDTILFRQPQPGASLEAASARVTHVPQIGVRIE